MTAIQFSEKGQGSPVVMLHGFCEIGAMWEDIATALEGEFHIYFPDLPGFGKTQIASNDITLEEVALQLEKWMEAQKIEHPVVIGHSLGGYIALALLELMGDRIKGIGLIHSTTFEDDEEKKDSRKKTMAFIHKQGVDKFVTTFVPQLFTASTRTQFEKQIDLAVTQSKESSLDGLIAFTKAMHDRKSRFPIVENFKGKKLLIAGTDDRAINIEASRLQKNAFSTYHELEGIGHMGQIERKEEVIELLRDFLNN